MFNQPELKDENQPDRLNVHKLLCLGLMLCGGEVNMKARVFYDVLQDNMQKHISSSDKDFKVTFRNFIVLASYMMMRVYQTESNTHIMTGHYPDPRTE